MRLFLSLFSFCLLVLPTTLSAEAKADYEGTYRWGKRDAAPLAMQATKQEDGSLAVSYDFKWKGKDRTWKGTLSIDDKGVVSGTAQDEKGKRTWKVEGKVVDGALVCSHAEKKGENWKSSGTYKLSPK